MGNCFCPEMSWKPFLAMHTTILIIHLCKAFSILRNQPSTAMELISYLQPHARLPPSFVPLWISFAFWGCKTNINFAQIIPYAFACHQTFLHFLREIIYDLNQILFLFCCDGDLLSFLPRSSLKINFPDEISHIKSQFMAYK